MTVAPNFNTPYYLPPGSIVREDILVAGAWNWDRDLALVRIAGTLDVAWQHGVYVTGNGVLGSFENQSVVIEAGGVLRVLNVGDIAYGVRADHNGPSVQNRGLVEVTGALDAYGLKLNSDESIHLNAGVVRVTATGGDARGVAVSGRVNANFTNSGEITSHSNHGMAYGVVISGNTGVFTNTATGLIRASDETLGAGAVSVGLYVQADTTWNQAGVHNYGLIEGDWSVFLGERTATSPYYPVDTRKLQNESTGILRGDVVGSNLSAETIVNRGRIEGAVNLNGGNDLYRVEGSGRTTGMVSGGDGNDTLYGGSQFDYLHGNKGNDWLSGDLGGDWVVGGQGNDNLYGDEDGDIVWGNLGSDSCYGGTGDDQVRGGQGDDLVSGDAGNDFIAGDRGNDTIYGGSGADIFHSFAEADQDLIMDFKRAEGDVLNLLAGSTYTVAEVSGNVIVSIVGGAQVALIGVQLSALTPGWLTVG